MRDHLGGGFHRYSVDGDWRVPHFEKMLYDQAQLVLAYLEAAQLTGERVLRRRWPPTRSTTCCATWPTRKAASSRPRMPTAFPGAAADPAPHKSEGAFYIWRDEEIGTRSARTPTCSACVTACCPTATRRSIRSRSSRTRTSSTRRGRSRRSRRRTGRSREEVEAALERRATDAARAARPRGRGRTSTTRS